MQTNGRICRVAVVAPEHPLTQQHGGIARYLRDYLPELARRTDVHLVSIEAGPDMPGLTQHVIPGCGWLPSPLRPPLLSRRIVRLLRTIQPDVVEYANWLGLGCLDNGPWARVVRLSTPVKYGSLRGGILPRLARPLHHLWEKQTVKNADLWISNSQENLETCVETYQIAHKPAVIIPHAIKTNDQRPSPNARDVLFVGRAESRKGIDTLIEAWTRLDQEGRLQGRVLHVVGRDTIGEGKGYLNECFAKIGRKPDSIILHGPLDNDALVKLRQQCPICVVPSRYESFGMVAVEAFAAGQAVIASRVGGLQEVVEDGVDGILVPASDTAGWIRALADLFSHPDQVRLMGGAGKIAIRERFAPEAMVRSSLQAYARAVELNG